MKHLVSIQIKAPYLILMGEESSPVYAKTGVGIVQWSPELVAGQLRFSEKALDLGVPDMSVAEARAAGVKSMIIGVAPIGGIVPESWWEAVREAVRHGLDVVCGLHIKLSDHPQIVSAAEKSGSRLIDVRVPPADIPIGTGIKRSGMRLLTVGQDCSIGKKYTALALNDAMSRAGMDSTYRATGQTGIIIAGEGIPIDAVIADFISGAAEVISPDNIESHWDIIEGQGSIFHPAYAGVALGLLHGSQPDAFIVCHDATRTHVSGWDGFPLPAIAECIEEHVRLGCLTNPSICCVGISVNTSGLPTEKRKDYLSALSAETGLPCVDPLIDGCSEIVNFIQGTFYSEQHKVKSA